MQNEDVTLYESPSLYDVAVPPGPCDGFYRRLAARTGGPVLELGCGTGRLSVPLAQDGHEVVGLDASTAMLGAASRKAEAADVEVEFVQGDMRAFELGREFALVLVSCNSLSHLTSNEELIGALRHIVRHLARGGLFAFDVINPRMSDLAQSGESRENLHQSELAPASAAVEVLLAYDPVSQVRVLQWHVTGSWDAVRRTEEMRLRTIFPQELPLLLSAAGLELIARFGDFDGNPLSAESLNQVCIAREAGQRVHP